MTAMVGGSVVCFVIRVLETLQSLFIWGRGIISLLFPLGVVVSDEGIFPVVGSFFVLCVGGKKGVMVASAGTT